MVFFPLVPDPRHRLRIGTHIRGWDILVRPHNFVDLVDELASDAFFFFATELSRIHTDAAFGTAVRNVHDRRFPSHQGSQGPDLIQVDFPVVTQATFHGSASIAVLHAVAN